MGSSRAVARLPEIEFLAERNGSALVMVAFEDSILTCGSGGCGAPKLLYRVTTGPDGQQQATLMLITTADQLEIEPDSYFSDFELYAYGRGNSGLDAQTYRVDLLGCDEVCVPMVSRSLAIRDHPHRVRLREERL